MIRPHILVVDDDLDTLVLISMVLEQQGYRVSRAAEAQAAWPIIESDPPDLLVLDVMMPGEDGFSMTRHLRHNPSTADLPVILFTAKGLLDDKATGFQAGADDYLTKPVHPEDLLARVRAILARRAPQTHPPASASRPQVVACVGVSAGADTASAAVGLTRALARLDLAAVAVGPVNGSGDALSALLADPDSLTPEHVEAALTPLDGAGSALCGPSSALIDPPLDDDTLHRLLGALAALADTAVFDLGAVSGGTNCPLITQADRLLLTATPTRESLTAAHHTLNHLCDLGVARPHTSLVLVQQAEGGTQPNTGVIREGLGIASVVLIPARQRASAAPYHPLALSLRQRDGAASGGI